MSFGWEGGREDPQTPKTDDFRQTPIKQVPIKDPSKALLSKHIEYGRAQHGRGGALCAPSLWTGFHDA